MTSRGKLRATSHEKGLRPGSLAAASHGPLTQALHQDARAQQGRRPTATQGRSEPLQRQGRYRRHRTPGTQTGQERPVRPSKGRRSLEWAMTPGTYPQAVREPHRALAGGGTIISRVTLLGRSNSSRLTARALKLWLVRLSLSPFGRCLGCLRPLLGPYWPRNLLLS